MRGEHFLAYSLGKKQLRLLNYNPTRQMGGEVNRTSSGIIFLPSPNGRAEVESGGVELHDLMHLLDMQAVVAGGNADNFLELGRAQD